MRRITRLDRASPDLLAFKRRLLEFVAEGDWEASVFAQNVILETMEYTVFRAHAESADPATAEVLEGVIKDERRHLGFGENDLGRRLSRQPDNRRRLRRVREELDPLVLRTLDSAMQDVGASEEERAALSQDYMTAIERLGLTT